jgi:hypothetical protein
MHMLRKSGVHAVSAGLLEVFTLPPGGYPLLGMDPTMIDWPSAALRSSSTDISRLRISGLDFDANR